MRKRQIIWSFVWSNLWVVLLAIALNLLSGFTRTEGASYLERITDALGLGQIDPLWRLALPGAAIMVSSYMLRWLGASVSRYLSKKLMFETRQKVIAHLEKIPFLSYEQYSIGDVQSRMINDVEEATDIFYIVLSRILNNLSLFVCSAVYMATINWVVTVVVVGVALAMGALNAKILKKMKQIRAESRKELGGLSTLTESVYNASDTVKAYGAKEYVKRVFGRQKDRYNRQVFAGEKVDGARLVMYNFVNNFALYGAMVYMGWLGIRGVVSVGEAVVLIYLIKQILVPIEVIFRWMSALVSSLASWERVEQLLCGKEEAAPVQSELGGALEITGTSFSYDGARDILANIGTVRLEPGKIYYIYGESGSGKTTLLKLWMGLYPRGGMQINGCDTQLNGNCAYASAKFELFPMTIYENIAMGSDAVTKEQCNAMLERLGFGEWIGSLAQGIDTPVLADGSNLSGGQKQAIVNARALLSGRKVIVLDEPFSALDSRSEAALHDVLEMEKKKKILLITSHRAITKNWYDETICIR